MVATIAKAANLAPKAYGDKGGKAGQPLDKVDDLTYDVHHLTAFDNHPVDLERFKQDPEAYLKGVATFGVQCLVNRLFELPTDSSPVGPVAELPAKVTLLPRAKPIPPPKKETKWEKFAKEKGIQKKKRSRMEWDEASQEYKPRWGYKAVNGGVEDLPIVEIKEGKDPFVDPWTEARQAKKARVEKNLKQHMKNRERANPKPTTFGLPVDMTANKKDAAGGAGAKKKKGKEDGLKALEVAQRSTASVGRFDRQLEGEPAKKEPKVKKTAPAVDPSTLKTESKRMKDILQAVIRPKSAGDKRRLVNIDALEPEAGFKRKKGRGAQKGSNKRKKK